MQHHYPRTSFYPAFFRPFQQTQAFVTVAWWLFTWQIVHFPLLSFNKQEAEFPEPPRFQILTAGLNVLLLPFGTSIIELVSHASMRNVACLPFIISTNGTKRKTYSFFKSHSSNLTSCFPPIFLNQTYFNTKYSLQWTLMTYQAPRCLSMWTENHPLTYSISASPGTPKPTSPFPYS